LVTTSYCIEASSSLLYSGMKLVFTSDNSDDTILKTIEQEKVVMILSTPVVLNRLLQAIKSDPQLWSKYGSTLRAFRVSGEHLSAQLSAEWTQLTGVPVINIYGITEVRAVPVQPKPGSIGKPSIEMEIFDDDFNPLPSNSPGLLAVKSFGGCIYWKRNAEQATFVKNGWNVPGDIAKKDDDGFFWYLGRKDDNIVAGDGNIWPLVVEGILRTHECVKEVAVFGKQAHDRTDGRSNIVKAVVVPSIIVADTDLPQFKSELIRHVAERRVLFERLDEVEIVPSISLLPNGKVDRKALRNN